MLFGGWIGTMTGLSHFSTNSGLAYMDRWPPLVPPVELYGAPEEDDIPEKWRNLARHAKKKRPEKVAEQNQTKNQEATERRQETWTVRQQLVWIHWTGNVIR